MSLATINTSFGQSKVVSLRQFLEHVRLENYSECARQITYAVFPESYFGGFASDGHLLSSWTELTVPLFSGELENIARRGLSSLSKTKIDPNLSLLETLEDIVTDHVMNFGTAEYLVRIGPRHWMAADPRDYVVFAEGQRLAFASLSVSRNNTFVSPRRYTK